MELDTQCTSGSSSPSRLRRASLNPSPSHMRTTCSLHPNPTSCRRLMELRLARITMLMELSPTIASSLTQAKFKLLKSKRKLTQPEPKLISNSCSSNKLTISRPTKHTISNTINTIISSSPGSLNSLVTRVLSTPASQEIKTSELNCCT
jgi:hypothetical protein